MEEELITIKEAVKLQYTDFLYYYNYVYNYKGRIKGDNINGVKIYYFYIHRDESVLMKKYGLDKLPYFELKHTLDKYQALYLMLHMEFYIKEILIRDDEEKTFNNFISSMFIHSEDILAIILKSCVNIITNTCYTGKENNGFNIRIKDTDVMIDSLQLVVTATCYLFYGAVIGLTKEKYGDETEISKLVISVIINMVTSSYVLVPTKQAKYPYHCFYLLDLLLNPNVEVDDENSWVLASISNILCIAFNEEFITEGAISLHNKYDTSMCRFKVLYPTVFLSNNPIAEISKGYDMVSNNCQRRYLAWDKYANDAIKANIGVNMEIHKMLYDVLEKHTDTYRYLGYISYIYDYTIISDLANDERINSKFMLHKLFIKPREGGYFGVDLKRALFLIGSISKFANKKTLVILNGDMTELFTHSMAAIIRSNPLTKHLYILCLINIAYFDIKGSEDIGLDLVLNSAFLRNKCLNSIKDTDNTVNIKKLYPNVLICNNNTRLERCYYSSDEYDEENNELGVFKLQNFTIEKNYNIKYLNIKNNNSEDIAKKLDKFYTNYPNDSISLLLYGDSGNGKSLFVSYLANKCNKKLYTVSSGEFLAKYVGDGEEHIKEVFNKLTNNDILLIEEADGLMLQKDKESKSWERSTVNEFLVHLERFKGTLIVTTNNLDCFDKAFLRRFNLKLEFLSLRDEDIPKVIADMKKIYKLKGDLSKTSLLGLRLGDIGNVNRNIKFHNITTVDEYANELKIEISNRKDESERKLGFR